jgi:hypothetical protein
MISGCPYIGYDIWLSVTSVQSFRRKNSTSILGKSHKMMITTVESGYNDIGLYDNSSIASAILWYHLIPHC